MKLGVTRKTGGIRVRADKVGESLEQKLRRYKTTREQISINGQVIYQERAAGVDPLCDIRTDRHELALQAFDKVTKTHLAARAHKFQNLEKDENGNIKVETPVT